MQKIVLATQNPHKIMEMREFLSDVSSFEFVPISDFTKEEPEENGTTFEENALIKARACFDLTGLPSLSDDSGICVHALDGAPGIHTAGWFIQSNGIKSYAYGWEKMETQLKNKDKRATAVCCFAYKDQDEEVILRANVQGRLVFDRLTPDAILNGFGFDPIFIADDAPEQKTFHELGEGKKLYSHRAKAIEKLKVFLKTKDLS